MNVVWFICFCFFLCICLHIVVSVSWSNARDEQFAFFFFFCYLNECSKCCENAPSFCFPCRDVIAPFRSVLLSLIRSYFHGFRPSCFGVLLFVFPFFWLPVLFLQVWAFAFVPPPFGFYFRPSSFGLPCSFLLRAPFRRRRETLAASGGQRAPRPRRALASEIHSLNNS